MRGIKRVPAVQVTCWASARAWFLDQDLRSWIDHLGRQGIPVRYRRNDKGMYALFRPALPTDYEDQLEDYAFGELMTPSQFAGDVLARSEN